MKSEVLFEEAKLRWLWGGFQTARVVITSNKLGIFDHLKNPRTPSELAVTVGTEPRATKILLNSLSSIGLVKKTGEKYRNTSLSSRFLVKGTPYYQGDIIRYADDMWNSWSDLDEVLKTGRPSANEYDHRTFIDAMHNLSLLRCDTIINALKLKGVKKALDLGSGLGTYSMAMASKGVAVTLFDLPETVDVEIAQKRVKQAKVRGIRFKEGDFLTDGFGKGYDLIFISQILHLYSDADCILLLNKCREALNPGGRTIILETLIEEGGISPAQGAMFSIHMLVTNENGRCYTTAELAGLLSRTGFQKIKEKIFDSLVLVEGQKANVRV